MSIPKKVVRLFAWQTRKGGILVELDEKMKDKASFSKAVIEAVGDTGTVSTLEPKVTLEIRDIDGYSDGAEVNEALTREYLDLAEKLSVKLTKLNKQGLKIAIVKMDEAHAKKLLAAAKLKVGWV